MKRAAIIVAGGKGTRMGADIPKQFLPINGVPILCLTVSKFIDFDPEITIFLVLPTSLMAYWLQVSTQWIPIDRCKLIPGGQERFFSVKNAIDNLPDDIDIVAIHDGVRPLVSVNCIARCFAEATLNGNAVPAVDVVESLRFVDSNGSRPLDRKSVKIIQTPQVFITDDIKKAYQQPYDEHFTDDASVMEKFGKKINLAQGEKQNIKITTFDDLQYAVYLLNQNKK